MRSTEQRSGEGQALSLRHLIWGTYRTTPLMMGQEPRRHRGTKHVPHTRGKGPGKWLARLNEILLNLLFLFHLALWPQSHGDLGSGMHWLLTAHVRWY